jgi:predicted metallopeptidase
LVLINYQLAPDVRDIVEKILKIPDFSYVPIDRVLCVRSKGSKAKRTLARIHAMSRIWQYTLSTYPYYIIEVISEEYDNLPSDEKEKTIIHELLHVPKSFRGGFRHHKGWINNRKIKYLHKKLNNKI